MCFGLYWQHALVFLRWRMNFFFFQPTASKHCRQMHLLNRHYSQSKHVLSWHPYVMAVSRYLKTQEPRLSQRDRATRCLLRSCQLLHNCTKSHTCLFSGESYRACASTHHDRYAHQSWNAYSKAIMGPQNVKWVAWLSITTPIWGLFVFTVITLDMA